MKAVIAAFVLALAASLAAAAGMDLEADLELTDGFVRKGTYVPVRLTMTNRTDHTFDLLRISTGSPVVVEQAVTIPPTETIEKTIPVLAGSLDLVLDVEGIADGHSRASASAVLDGAVFLEDREPLIVVDESVPRPGDHIEALKKYFAGEPPRVLRRPFRAIKLMARCGMIDGAVAYGAVLPPGDYAMSVADENGRVSARPSPFPWDWDAAAVRQPAPNLFADRPWPAGTRRNLWLGLAVFGLLVLVAAVGFGRRHRWALALAVVVLGAAAAAGWYLLRPVQRTRVTEVRAFYVTDVEGPEQPLERFVRLVSRGGEPARVPLGPKEVLPVPVVGKGSMLEAYGTLRLGPESYFENRAGSAGLTPPALILHAFGRDLLMPGAAGEAGAEAIQELIVAGDRAWPPGDPTLTRSVSGWVTRLTQSKDPRRQYVGRSLAWWTDIRQPKIGASLAPVDDQVRVRLAWYADQPPADAEVTRLPALVIQPE